MSSFLYVGIFCNGIVYHRNQFKFIRNDNKSFRQSIINAISFIKANYLNTNDISNLNACTIETNLKKDFYIKWCRLQRYYSIVISIDGYCPYIWNRNTDLTLVDWNKLKWDYTKNKNELIYINGSTEEKPEYVANYTNYLMGSF